MKSIAPLIERLEARIAPASVVVPFTDFDGDLVKVTASKPGPAAPPLDITDFAFAGGGIGIQLNLTAVGFEGADITFAVTKKPGGDGAVNVGYINATGIDLGKVTVPGDLCTIDAGDVTTTDPGVKSITVRSMGIFGQATGAPDFNSDIVGPLGSLTVKGDVKNVTLKVTGNGMADDAHGTIGSIKIGGSIVGGDAGNSAQISSTGDIAALMVTHDVQGGGGPSSGRVTANGKLGSVKIGGSLIGGVGSSGGTIRGGATGVVKIGGDVRGGDGDFTGRVRIDGTLDSISIGGSLLGGAGTESGEIKSNGQISAVKIGHDLRGGDGTLSGFIDSGATLPSVTIGGSLIGGTKTDSGFIQSNGDIGVVKIGRDVRGGAGPSSGHIGETANIASVTVGGSLVAGDQDGSGRIDGSVIGSITILHDIRGGVGGKNSGVINASVSLASVKVGGSVIGGDKDGSGQIFVNGHLMFAKIGHDVVGGKGNASGSIQTFGNADTVKIGGSLLGGSGPNTGEVLASLHLGAVTIGRDVIGQLVVAAPFANSGGITAGSIDSVTIGGSVVGAAGHVTGFILATAGDLGTVKIARDLRGASISGAQLADESGYIEASGRIGSVTIGGSIISGIDNSSDTLTKNGSIRAVHDLGVITVRGSLIGNIGPQGTTPVIISAGAQTVAPPPGTFPTAIGALTVGGSVVHASIFGDYSIAGAPQGFGAQIGPVKVTRNWIASNLVAGIRNLGADGMTGGSGADADNVNFGDTNDQEVGLGPISDHIVSVVIGGFVAGSDASGDHFGFSAVTIGSFKAGGFTATLTGNDAIELSPATGDVTIRDL